MYRTLDGALTPTQRLALQELLDVPQGHRVSRLELRRRPPTSSTAAGPVGICERLERLRSPGVGRVDLGVVPPQRLEAFIEHGKMAKAQTF